MIRIKSERVLLVADSTFSVQLLPSNKQLKHISAADKVFPALFDLKPNLIVFDHDFLGKDGEKILRRIRGNTFYNKVKICCYKTSRNVKTDDLLKTLGVDHIIYQDELVEQPMRTGKNIAGAIGAAIDASVMRLVSAVSY